MSSGIVKEKNVPEWLKGTCEEVIKNSKEYRKEKVFKVTKKEYEKIDKTKAKVNPYEKDENKFSILTKDKEIIHQLDKLFDFER